MTDTTQTPDPQTPPAAPAKLGWLDYLKMLYNGRSAVEEAINQGKMLATTAKNDGLKNWSFWLSAIAALGAVAAQAGALIPPPYGVIVASVATLAFSISRGFAKNSDPLGGVKPQGTATETWHNILVAVIGVLGAVKGVLSPQAAAQLALASTVAQSIASGLAAGGAQPDVVLGPVVTTAQDPVAPGDAPAQGK